MPVFDVSALEAVMPEPEEVRTAAKSLLDSATAIDATTETAAQSWGKLQAQGVYVIDGSEVVFSAYRPIQRASGNLAEDFGTLDAAANVFADAVTDLKARLADVKTRAAAFNKKIAGDDEWNKDKDLIGEQDGITNELSAIRSELSGHEREFAQAISDMYGGNEYVEFSGNGPGEGQFEHGVSSDVLNAAAIEGGVPWAHPRAFDKPWYRDAGDAYWSYTKAFYGAGLDTVLGLATLAGLGGKDAFVQSWTGVGTLAHDLFIVTGAGMPFMMATGQEQKVKDSAGNLLEIAKDTIHLDEWKTDPASALGATAFDVVTTIGTGGAAAGVKGVSVAGKAADAAGDAGKLAKAGEAAAAGGRMAHIAETTGIAKGVRAVEEISVKIGEIKTTAVHAIHESVKNGLGRLGIGPGVKDDLATPKAAPAEGPGNPANGQHLVDADGHAPSKANPDSSLPGNRSPDDHAGPRRAEPADGAGAAGEAAGGADGNEPSKDAPGKSVDDPPGVPTIDASGQPTEVRFPDGTRIPVDYPIETPRNDIIGELGPALESIGKDEAWLRNVVEREVESLSTDELQALMELRHSVPPLDADTVMQKVIDGDSFEALLDGSDPYGNSAGGFITRASDAAGLRTPEEVYNALRLDYENTPYLPKDDRPVYAVQFKASEGLKDIQIPDGRAQDVLGDRGMDAVDSAGRAYPEPHMKRDPNPNMGHGWTGSTVESSKVIPEYAVRQRTGVPYQHGDVIWEINKSGERVLAAIFDESTGTGMWRRVQTVD